LAEETDARYQPGFSVGVSEPRQSGRAASRGSPAYLGQDLNCGG